MFITYHILNVYYARKRMYHNNNITVGLVARRRGRAVDDKNETL